jgi:hypothetical protein
MREIAHKSIGSQAVRSGEPPEFIISTPKPGKASASSSVVHLSLAARHPLSPKTPGGGCCTSTQARLAASWTRRLDDAGVAPAKFAQDAQELRQLGQRINQRFYRGIELRLMPPRLASDCCFTARCSPPRGSSAAEARCARPGDYVLGPVAPQLLHVFMT